MHFQYANVLIFIGLGIGLCAWAILRRWRMAVAQTRTAGFEVQSPK